MPMQGVHHVKCSVCSMINNMQHHECQMHAACGMNAKCRCPACILHAPCMPHGQDMHTTCTPHAYCNSMQQKSAAPCKIHTTRMDAAHAYSMEHTRSARAQRARNAHATYTQQTEMPGAQPVSFGLGVREGVLLRLSSAHGYEGMPSRPTLNAQITN